MTNSAVTPVFTGLSLHYLCKLLIVRLINHAEYLPDKLVFPLLFCVPVPQSTPVLPIYSYQNSQDVQQSVNQQTTVFSRLGHPV